jgi:hypothetical protein
MIRKLIYLLVMLLLATPALGYTLPATNMSGDINFRSYNASNLNALTFDVAGPDIDVNGRKFTDMANGMAAGDGMTMEQGWDKTNKTDIPVIFASEFGAVGGDGIDDWQSIQNAINATPGDGTTNEGSIIQLPAGILEVSRPLIQWKAGVIIRGVGYPATRLQPATGFVGNELINISVNRSFYRAFGVGLQRLQIRMMNIPADGVVIRSAYDCSEFSNLWVAEVNDSHQAMRFEPNPYASTPVTQGVTMDNVQLMHNSTSSTAVILRLEKCQEMQLYGVKCLEGQLDIFNCMGILLDGCSFTGLNTTAIKISNDNTYYTGWITIIGPTFEGVGGILDIDGTSTYSVRYVTLINPRYYATILAGSNLNYAQYCDIDGGQLLNTMTHSNYNTIRMRSDNPSLVVDDGTTNMVIAPGQTYFQLSKSSTPGIRFRVSGRWDSWDVRWSANSFVDYGFQIQYNDTSLLKLVAAPASGATSMLLYENDGGVYKLSPVVTGADDSGGAGYRMLRVAN